MIIGTPSTQALLRDITTARPLHLSDKFYSLLVECASETQLTIEYIYWEYAMTVLLYQIKATGIDPLFTGGASLSIVCYIDITLYLP